MRTKKLQGREQEVNNKFNKLTEPKGKNRITMQEAMMKLASVYNIDTLTIRKCITKENLNKAKNRLTKPQQIVYNKLIEGETQSQIAHELRVTRQNVGYMLKIIRKKGYNVEITRFKGN